MKRNKKIYFASDFHLGIAAKHSSKKREKIIVSWLETIKTDATHLYLVGDIFDHWFEYKEVTPKGYTRFLGALAKLSDNGVKIILFLGNHDMWMFDYLKKELNIDIIPDQLIIRHGIHKFFIAHGDGLGPSDIGYKIIKKIFRNKICQWLFARLHPNFALWLMKKSSNTSRSFEKSEEHVFQNKEEWLVQFCESYPHKESIDFFVFGHRHIPISYSIKDSGHYYNLGDWLHHYTYGVYDGATFELKIFEHEFD